MRLVALDGVLGRLGILEAGESRNSAGYAAGRRLPGSFRAVLLAQRRLVLGRPLVRGRGEEPPYPVTEAHWRGAYAMIRP